jgi:hypothetical protein
MSQRTHRAMTPKLKRRLAISASLLAVAGVVGYHHVRTHPLAGVAITIGGIDPNHCYRDSSVVAVFVTITNSSPVQIDFDTTYQTKTPSGWERPNRIKTWHLSAEDDHSPIPPFTARIVHVPVPGRTDAPWRIVVRCIGNYNYNTLTPKERFWLKAYFFVFGTAPERFLVSGEQPANQVAAATLRPGEPGASPAGQLAAP